MNGAPPVAFAFNTTVLPAQTAVFGVAVALAPTGVTVTVTGNIDGVEQPVAGFVAVTEYVVVTIGLATGFMIVEELKPVVGLHV